MKRRFAVLLTCALIAFGQRIPSPPSAATPDPWVIDALALDASGRPVPDLTADDFEIVQGGKSRKISNFTWFDTRLHAAISPPGEAAQLPALGLVPDEIRRNIVVIVDDLGLSPAGINAVRDSLRAFVASAMLPGDRLSVLRSSGGSGVDQQLTGDTRILVNAIDGIRYLGGSTSAAVAGSAFWETLGCVLEGLRHFDGRKVVMLLSENPGVPGPWERAASEAAHAAHAAGAVVYAIQPLPGSPAAATAAAGALESLVRDTGGLFGGNFASVLQNEQGYYAIGFQPEDTSIDLSGRLSPGTPAVLKVRRPGVVVRYRAGYISRRPPQVEFAAPLDHTVLVNNALASPFAAADIRARLTALLSDYSGQNPALDLTLLFDTRELSFIRDLQDIYHATARMRVAAFSDDGRLTVPLEREFKITLQPAAYRAGIEYGLRLRFEMKLPLPGAWQIRALVADGASDRIGSASQFVDIPKVRQGALALSGLTLHGASAAADSAPADPREDAAVRIFKPGSNCVFSYSVFGALTGPDKKSSLDVQTRILAEGRVAFEATQKGIAFGEAALGARRQVSGKLSLEQRISPGDYILQVTVRDTLAPPGERRTATQFIDFEVRQ
jgi:VWFA-related protein